MTEDEHRKLDTAVAEKVMGLKVLGETACWAPDGCWSVMPGWSPGKDLFGGEIRPVYEPNPDLFDLDDIHAAPVMFGVNVHSLEPVPWYSTDPAAALEALAKTGADFGIHRRHQPADGRDEWEVWVCRVAVGAPTFAEAVCRAALAAVVPAESHR